MQNMNELKRTTCLVLMLSVGWLARAQDQSSATAPTYAATPAAAPPPSAGAKRSMADLEKLVAPIALYPDQLLATMLPAAVYPLEIVQAARFVADANNLAKLDEQPWDDNVKAVAQVPDAIKKMNDDLQWTMDLGQAFLAQDKDVMDAIQNMRGKAQKAGTLQTTAQQVVTVTNMVVEKTVEEKVVVVTNTVVQIQPASTTTVYVPTYNPATVYYPPPAYYVNPYPLLTFGAGMAMGAIIANNCDWNHGGCYNNNNININNNNNFNRNNINNNNNRGGNNNRSGTTGQKWQPDQSRLNKSGAPSAGSRDARGWSGGSQAGQRPSTGSAGSRPSTGNVGARPSTGSTGGRTTSDFSQRPSAGTGSTGGQRPSTGGSGARTTSNFSGPSSGQRPASSAGASRSSPSSANRSSSGGSAFGGVSSGSSARSSSSRGAASRGGGSSGRGGGGGRSGGGGGGGRR